MSSTQKPPSAPRLQNEALPRLASTVSSGVASSETVGSTRPIAHSRRNYGTVGTTEPMGHEPIPDEGQVEGSSRIHSSQSLPPDKPKKPSVTRRISSRRQVPHKGQEFSTDDDVLEVEEDKAKQQATNPQPSPRLRPLRTQSSTLRRRLNVRPSPLARADSDDESGEESFLPESSLEASGARPPSRQSEAGSQNDSNDGNNDDSDNHDGNLDHGDGDENDGETSDAESFTLKDRQQAINETHPFGIRLWKPALYKKSRSVEKTAEGDIHSSPGGRVGNMLFLANLLWTVFFGWWLALAALVGAVACFAFAYSTSAVEYGKVFLGLSWYLLYPFGSFVRLETDEHYAEEDEGEGRSISEYEQWQNGDLEHGRLFFGPRSSRSLVGRRRNSIDSVSEQDSLLGRTQRAHTGENQLHSKRRLFGRGEWTLGRVVFFLFLYLFVGPLMLFVSIICWLLVFWIPMGRVTLILFDHLRRHPLALSFHSDTAYTRLSPGSSSSILLCTYRAAGTRYWKYTVDGTNIFLINLLGVVLFVIFDYFLLAETLKIHTWLTHPGFIFTLALVSIIPLAYFIGQAVASISAQSSMGMGAAVNAFFSTVVEVYLYCVALTEGKAQLVEGSIIGSIFAGILFLPGLSMCFGAIKRKTQRFNVKSAGVTSTMLMFAVIAAFGPTLFYQIYGSHELNCYSCAEQTDSGIKDCRRCYFAQAPAVNDHFFRKVVLPYSWFAALFLFLSYVIGLWFTLRTHAALIWATEAEEKKTATVTPEHLAYEPRHLLFPHGPSGAPRDCNGYKGSIRDSQLYKRILGQSLKHVGLSENAHEHAPDQPESSSASNKGTTPHLVPPRAEAGDGYSSFKGLRGYSGEDSEYLVRQVTEVAATAAAVAARDAARARKPSVQHGSARQGNKTPVDLSRSMVEDDVGLEHTQTGGGHDAPNWSKGKSSIILLGATIFYAIIAEILVNTVDVVLESVDIDEKFLGITLFALVPNTTEFLNAISFAMNGNIALSMEIGSAYALQVCLLQIPAVVLFSAFYSRMLEPSELLSHSFNLIFPQWDMITVILCVFLLSYVHGEGKSNYFKGCILVLTYLVVVIGFYLSGYSNVDTMGIDRFDTLALGPMKSESFRTIGHSTNGRAF
ncbi:calcium/hydrogen antiporter [Aspergillus clavatus NRRL 1]|uniref:Calcium permease family membrane transporter n=1 Tax=Aspergillus clavatus (strain ATCC 1007 / CBS 513.65 / DSM 816 / NCTC 3887 / NRRL 1 / QM 1276 / 107) TaxID=344612 RepID=A1C8Z8_ASPCL|nr:calcium permease family membrane transporter [Aspergillus clavatus NRRL 1]EAW13322.1 calcium permease family membrane transporter [Aspergillus clavatus NRRL 1]